MLTNPPVPYDNPSRGLLRDCTTSPINRFAALITNVVTRCWISMALINPPSYHCVHRTGRWVILCKDEGVNERRCLLVASPRWHLYLLTIWSNIVMWTILKCFPTVGKKIKIVQLQLRGTFVSRKSSSSLLSFVENFQWDLPENCWLRPAGCKGAEAEVAAS